jgi:hypothetical protein
LIGVGELTCRQADRKQRRGLERQAYRIGRVLQGKVSLTIGSVTARSHL